MFPTQLIIVLNVSLKHGGVQSRYGDPTIYGSVGEGGIGNRDAKNYKGRDDCVLFR